MQKHTKARYRTAYKVKKGSKRAFFHFYSNVRFYFFISVSLSSTQYTYTSLHLQSVLISWICILHRYSGTFSVHDAFQFISSGGLFSYLEKKYFHDHLFFQKNARGPDRACLQKTTTEDLLKIKRFWNELRWKPLAGKFSIFCLKNCFVSTYQKILHSLLARSKAKVKLKTFLHKVAKNNLVQRLFRRWIEV